jgi:hypothetical protein
VGQFGEPRQADFVEVFADEIFDRLDIVLGRRLELGNPRDIGVPKMSGDISKTEPFVGAQFRSEEPFIDESNNPLNLDVNARTVEPGLGQVFADFGHRRVVATIERAERLRGEGHTSILAVFSPTHGFAPPSHLRLSRSAVEKKIADTSRVMCEPASPAQNLVDDAIAVLALSQSRGGWVGPARNAFDGLVDEFRARLIVLSLRLRSRG